MPLTIEDVVVPNLTRTLKALSHILQKGADYAESKGMDPAVLVNSRLIADMHPLKRQVQMVTDTVRRVVCQLGEQEVPSVEDTEESFAELQARIQSTIEFVEAFDKSKLVDAESRSIHLALGDSGIDLSGRDFVMGMAIPNIYFHAATAYNILRQNGVDVGKMDFLGAP
ncbi:DUF1993 domain-containing protein [Pseudomonadales bacterium]|jgi:hypothetical protein|nr:DUF1993 domain-containing protein [Pseudomonadales bacterium]MDC1018849.1 DUF1993 domain-containing protein [Pseudomonadales bacterium]|tara:strand:- start:2559 stop:3065 length:507 start_codon:yes stop_codon:yes gene_type:complete